jgi:hypothetical protein
LPLLWNAPDLADEVNTPVADIEQEAARLLQAGADVPVRLLGGLAIAVATPGHRLLPRPYKDIDLMAPAGAKRPLLKLFADLGYDSDERRNELQGHRRLLFWDTANQRQVDVFVGTFEMCHKLPLAERLTLAPDTLPLADLLLTKLQVFALNDKDRRDILTLLYHHPLVSSDGEPGINTEHIARLCAADWGLWRTATLNLERARDGLGGYGLASDQEAVLTTRIDELRERIDAAPKSTRWKLRARVGERVQWYEEPEEVH